MFVVQFLISWSVRGRENLSLIFFYHDFHLDRGPFCKFHSAFQSAHWRFKTDSWADPRLNHNFKFAPFPVPSRSTVISINQSVLFWSNFVRVGFFFGNHGGATYDLFLTVLCRQLCASPPKSRNDICKFIRYESEKVPHSTWLFFFCYFVTHILCFHYLFF